MIVSTSDRKLGIRSGHAYFGGPCCRRRYGFPTSTRPPGVHLLLQGCWAGEAECPRCHVMCYVMSCHVMPCCHERGRRILATVRGVLQFKCAAHRGNKIRDDVQTFIVVNTAGYRRPKSPRVFWRVVCPGHYPRPFFLLSCSCVTPLFLSRHDTMVARAMLL